MRGHHVFCFKGVLGRVAPVSGQLYSLSIEPLLCRLRSRSAGLSLPGLPQSPALGVSAYADDVSIFTKDNNYVQVVIDSLGLFEKSPLPR